MSTEIERIKKLNTLPEKIEPEAKATCKHLGWEWNKHGRCCFNCGAFVVDFGD